MHERREISLIIGNTVFLGNKTADRFYQQSRLLYRDQSIFAPVLDEQRRDTFMHIGDRTGTAYRIGDLCDSLSQES